MRTLSLVMIVSYLITGCRKEVDMKEIFLKNQKVFKKIENPVKTSKRHIFEKATLQTNDSAFDSTYLSNFAKVFFATDCDVAYIVDGDVLIGCKKNLSKLFFTNKNIDDSVELLNFRGSLNDLLQNGKLERNPFAIPIEPKWYVVRDIESL